MNNMLFNRFKFLCVLGGLIACICVTSCSKETEGFIDGPEKEDPIPPSGRDVWSFDVKVVLDRATYKLYFSDEDIVKKKLKERFDEVAALYRGKNDITFFDADIKFNPIFEKSFVYDNSSEKVFQDCIKYRGNYPYLLIIDGCVGDYDDERIHSDWTGWGREAVCLFDNGLGKTDAGTVYDILSKYKTSEAITHELGHARGVPDIYAMDIKTNPICNLTFSPVECIMNICWGGESWSEYAQLLINRNKDLVRGDPGFYPLENPSFPEELTLKITSKGEPVNNVKVNLYGSKMYSNTVEDKPVSSYTTDKSGCISLNPKLVYTGPYGDLMYGVVLVEILYSENKSYKFVPVYDVQIPYLRDGEKHVQLDIEI